MLQIRQTGAPLRAALLCAFAAAAPASAQSDDGFGAYFGLHFGGGVAQFDGASDTDEIDFPGKTDDSNLAERFDLDGGLWGAQAGVDYRTGRILIGVEVDYTRLDIEDRHLDPNTPDADFGDAEVDWLASARLRVGLRSGRATFFVTTGLAAGGARYAFTNPDVDGDSGSRDFMETGFVLGGGVEHAFGDRLVLRAEALRYVFGGLRDVSGLTTDSDVGDAISFDGVTVARIAVAYRFAGAPWGSADALDPASIAWGGVTIGGQFGGGRASVSSLYDGDEIDEPNDVDDVVRGELFHDLDGVSGGVRIGYDHEVGPVVVGVFADWTALAWRDTARDPEGEFGGTDHARFALDWVASLEARLGLPIDRSLFYVSGGPAWIDARYLAVEADGPFDHGEIDVGSAGFALGVGLEHAVTDRWRFGVEARAYRFDRRFDASTLSSDSAPGDFARIDDVVLGVVGFRYRLGAR